MRKSALVFFSANFLALFCLQTAVAAADLKPEASPDDRKLFRQYSAVGQPGRENPKEGAAADNGKQAAPRKEQQPTENEAMLKERIPFAVSTDVSAFGYDLFREPPSTFAPVESVPVGPDYVLGPGDELRMNVWGAISGDFSLSIDRDGKVALPQAGPVHISGLTFREAKELLMEEFYRYYRPSEVKADVSMGKLRTIRIFVVGKAARPGSYVVSSLSTIINALFASGGPSRVGSMRDVQLKRGGRTIVHFDLYDFLLSGDKSKDARLMPEDVIFIPPAGPRALIAGQVKVPAIYEMKGETRIRDLIAMAGGVNAAGYLQKVQVERIQDNEVRTILDADLKDLAPSQDAPLSDGSTVKVYPVSDLIINAVSLTGNVTRPGQCQWSEGMRVSCLFRDPEKDLLPETCYEHALIERLEPPDYHREIIAFSLGKAIFDKDREEDKELRRYDTVIVYSKWDFAERPKVRVTGAVGRPDSFELRPNMKVSDMVKLAGGLLYYASYQAELTRVDVTQAGPRTERLQLDLKKALAGDPENDLPLQVNDYLFVRTVPEWGLYKTVNIGGEVLYPGLYAIKKGERISSVLKRAGGFTDKAYLKGAVFTRESVKAAQQKNLDEITGRLEQEMLARPAGASAQTSERLQQEQAFAEQRKRAFLARLRSVKAIGRIAIAMKPLEEYKGTADDVELEDGDSLTIPREPSSVQVAGSVYNQGAFIYQPKAPVEYYVRKAGGITRDADKGESYVLKVDGTTISGRSGGGFLEYDPESHSFAGGGLMSRKLDAGDTVVVPADFQKVNWLAEVKDITTILFQIAVSAGVAIAAF